MRTVARARALTLLLLSAALPHASVAVAVAAPIDEGTAGDAAVRRLAGTSRIETAIAVSEATFDAADTVVLARADAYADALVGAPLAASRRAPILLTDPDVLSQEVLDEVERLGASEVLLLGGEQAVSPAVEDTLEDEGLDVRRISGDDRAATAAAIADELETPEVLFVATGDDFPDALAVAPYAAFVGSPILLASRDALPPATESAIRRLSPDEIVVVGGEGAIGEEVFEDLSGVAEEVRRLSGGSRFGTASAVYDEALVRGMDPSGLWLATASNFPDALAAGPAVAAAGESLLLTDGNDIGLIPETRARIFARASEIDRITLLGGETAISSRARVQLDALVHDRRLPDGTTSIFPHHRLVGYYGNAESTAMGVLGETDPDTAAAQLMEAAAPFATPERPVMPVFELIVTVATSYPTPEDDYSRPSEFHHIERYLEAARRHGAYLLLDIQPGRNHFLPEVQRYERFLREPDVGIALDPEWRMEPDEVPGRTIGSVTAEEINQVIDYVAGIVREEHLPEKLFVIHQFRVDMMEDKELTQHPDELEVNFHIDGFGGRGAKLETYGALNGFPQYWLGFKLFYDEDTDLFAPSDVLAFDKPPDLITYQ